MTRDDDIRRSVGVLNGERLSVNVPEDVVDGEHSFGTVSTGGGPGNRTVTLRAGMTRLRVAGQVGVFTGFRYFPRVPDDYDFPVRGDVGDTKVDFEPDHGRMFPDEVADRLHPITDMTVADLVEGLTDGSIEPLPKQGGD